MISRRQLLGSAAGGLVLGRLPQVALPHVDGAAAFMLPAPTGPHAVGTVALHLVDHARTDPWIDRTAPRELMVQLWYPARHAHGRAWSWLTPSEAAPVGADLAQTVGAEPSSIPGLEVRAADLRFVLDELDIARAGVFGHSLGGATAARVVHDDPRAPAGINIDGTPYGSTALGKPFMVVAAETTTHGSDPAWAAFADGLHGWRREIRVAGARHLAFHDTVLLAPALPRITGATPALVAEAYGVIEARRAVEVTRAYVRAFFDLHLRRRRSPLLDGPSRRYPDVAFVPHGAQQTETFSLMGPK